MNHLCRRDFITRLGGAAVWPLGARAQQPALPVIGFLGSRSMDDSSDLVAGFRQGLREIGFVEGQNVLIEYGWAEGHYDRMPALATDLVRRRVTVIAAAGGIVSALAAKSATATIPIVFVTGGDPVQFGLVASLNRPRGNLTGVGALTNMLAAKQLELLHELLPTATLVAFLVNPDNPLVASDTKDLQAAARAMQQQILPLNARTESDIGNAFITLVQEHADALVVQSDPFFNGRRHQIVALAARHVVPMIAGFREFAAAGGLVSYGISNLDVFRQAGTLSLHSKLSLSCGRATARWSPAKVPPADGALWRHIKRPLTDVASFILNARSFSMATRRDPQG
jgi:putative ABC transport system substrate-binding protein